MTSKTKRPPLVQGFLRAWCQRLHGLPGGRYEQLAEITNRWWPTTTGAVKQAARRRQETAPVTDLGGFDGIHWIYAITNELYPYVDWFAFINPFSHTAAWVFGRNIEWWERRMAIPDPVWSALTDMPAELRCRDEVEVYPATPPYSAKYTLRSDRGASQTRPDNSALEQNVTHGVLCSDGGTVETPRRSDAHSFANPSTKRCFSEAASKAAPSTDAIMPSIDELARAAGLSKLKEKRLLQTAARDLRQGRVQIPPHIPATADERLKWVVINRLARLLGKDAFDQALRDAFETRAAA